MIYKFQFFAVLAWLFVTMAQVATAAGLVERYYSSAFASLKLLAVMVLFAFLNILYFHLLMAVSSYNVQGMMACSLVGLSIVWKHVPQFNFKIPKIPQSNVVRLVILISLPCILLRFLRSAVVPPLTWDALTYHLVKPAYWIQDESFLIKPAPEAWSYYEFFSYYVEILFSQAMMFTRNEGLVWMIEWIYTGMTSLAVFTLCRLRSADRAICQLAALFTFTCPAILNWLPSSHVDTISTAFLISGISFIIAVRKFPHLTSSNIALAAISLSLSCGMKNSLLPYCSTAIAIALILLWKRIKLKHIVLAGIFSLILLPPYFRAWYFTGNPLYPLELKVGNINLAGNDHLISMLTHGVSGPYTWSEFIRYFNGLLVGLNHLKFEGGRVEYLNFGLSGIGIVILALAGLLKTASVRSSWASNILLCCTIAINIWVWFSPMARVQGTWWLDYAGRFLIPMYLSMTVLATSIRGSIGIWFWSVLCIGNIIYIVPRGVDIPFELPYIIAVGVAMTVFIGAWAFITTCRVNVPRHLAILTFTSILLTAVLVIREKSKWPYYERLQNGVMFLQQGLSGTNSVEWTIWRDLSKKSASIINVSAGYGNAGMNWYRYPLFGDAFQHKLTYVSPYENNAIVNEEDSIKPKLVSLEEWLERLRSRGVRYAAALGPKHNELKWMEESPSNFKPISYSESKNSVLFLVSPFTPGKQN